MTNQSIDPARLKAAQSLLFWKTKGRLSYLERSSFASGPEAAFYRHLVSQVVRLRPALEFKMSSLTKKKPQQLHPEVWASLALGLLELEEAPPEQQHAAVHQAVELVAALGQPGLKGFVNGVLRSAQRLANKLVQDLRKQDLALRTSHDPAMVQSWKQQFGKAHTQEICQANNLAPLPQIWLKPGLDRERLLEDLAAFGLEPWDEGFVVTKPAGLFDCPAFVEGAFLVQDLSAARLVQIMKPHARGRLLDACAAPGGKLFQAEWALGGQLTELVGTEINPQRFERLQENAQRLGSQARLLCQDPLDLPRDQPFDLILADVPCTATGTIRKHPEIKWAKRLEEKSRNLELQSRLLQGLAELLAPGGILVYSTCSLEREENQLQVQSWLAAQAGRFQLVPVGQSGLSPDLITPQGHYQCLPGPRQMGAFAALLQKV